MDKSTHEEHLSQPLQTNNKQFKIAVTFLTGYNGIFNVTNSINKFYFNQKMKSRGYLLMKAISPKQIIHSQLNQISQH